MSFVPSLLSLSLSLSLLPFPGLPALMRGARLREGGSRIVDPAELSEHASWVGWSGKSHSRSLEKEKGGRKTHLAAGGEGGERQTQEARKTRQPHG